MIDSSSAARIRDLIAAGDSRTAANAAITALGPSIWRYLLMVLRDEEDVADAFSIFAETVWKGLPTFRWESSLSTWAYRLAYRAMLHVRDQSWRRRTRRLTTAEASQIGNSMRTKSFIRFERQREGLEKLIGMLDMEEQLLIALRIGQRLEWSEIATVITRGGQPVDASTLAKRFSRLKTRLAEMAREHGIIE